MYVSRLLLSLPVWAALANQVVLLDPTGNYFDADSVTPLTGEGVSDAIARTFYLGYLDQTLHPEFLKMPVNPLPQENLMLTVLGLEGLDLAELPNIQSLMQANPTAELAGRPAPHALAALARNEHSAAPIYSVSGCSHMAKSIDLEGSVIAYIDDEDGAVALGDESLSFTFTELDGLLAGDYWRPLVEDLDLDKAETRAVFGELELLRRTVALLRQPESAVAPAFFFVTLHAITEVSEVHKSRVAAVVDKVLGEAVAAFAEAPNGVAEVILITSSPFVLTEEIPRIERDAQLMRRFLSQDMYGNSSNYAASNVTYQEIYDWHFKTWTSVALGFIVYGFIYAMAFYGNYSADQLLYTTFNAKWDERKR